MKSKPNLSTLTIEDSSLKLPMDEMIQSYVEAINNFEESESSNLTDNLEQFLLHVAKTGEILASWGKVKKILVKKLKDVFDEFYKDHPYKSGQVHTNYENDEFEDMKERLLNLADEFENPPFTMQRLCELITNPRKNYTKCEKFMRAVEKNLMVVSSWNYSTRRSSESTDQANGGFDSRTSYNSVDRPWASLPHSPITTSAPVVRFVPKNSDSSKTSEVKTTDSDQQTGEEESSSNPSDDASLSEDNDKTQDSKGNDEGIEETSLKSQPTERQESDEAKTDEEVAVNEAGTSTITSEPCEESGSQDNADTTRSSFSSVTDTRESMIPCKKKDSLDEPLPGVGTLVEKHSVIKCTVTDASADTGDVSAKAVDFGFASAQTETSQAPVDSSPACSSQSFKRKHSDRVDDDTDVGSPSKRPKQDDVEEESEPVSQAEKKDD